MAEQQQQSWIEDIELEDAQIKWNFSHFDGRADTFNDEGDHNFTVVLPEEAAHQLLEEGWNIREYEGLEEGDPPEYTLKVKISYKYEPPKIYLIKGERKFRADERDLADIRRDTCDQIDVIITPSRWVHGKNSGISAYTKELYAKVRQSRFEARYADYEEV
jgi:hypothetical protein